jgi:hypothetical protein
VRLRLVFSRDEQRARLPGTPPEAVMRGERRVLMPRDGTAGGTWIAANDAGVVFALLNLNWASAHGPGEPDTRIGRLRTRGAVIPELVEACTAAAALDRTHTLDPYGFLPFRVLACDRQGWWMEAVSTGTTIHRSLRSLDAPLMRTSSGLGDDVVTGARGTLFHTMLGGAVASAAAQDRFHRHRWAGAQELSVLMNRPDARTVSITTVEVWDAGLRMLYHELPDLRSGATRVRRSPMNVDGAEPGGDAHQVA